MKAVNSVASSILGRSSQAIQKIRTRPEYKTFEDHAKNKLSIEQNPQVNVEQTPLPNVDNTISIEHSLQQTLLLPIYVEQTPGIHLNNNSSSTSLLNTTSNVKISPLQSLRGSRPPPANSSTIQTPVNLISRPVFTPSKRLLPTIPPTPRDTTNLLSITTIPVEIDISTPPATAEQMWLSTAIISGA